jgi:carboxylate-amine ligase
MPATLDDTIALATLCQVFVAKLSWLYKRGLRVPVLPTRLIGENKWRVMRSGLDAEVLDFVQSRCLGMRQSICDLLDFVDDVLDDLGSRNEINYLRMLLTSPRGTGADGQIAIYQQTGNRDTVIRFLMQQTVQDIPLERLAVPAL